MVAPVIIEGATSRDVFLPSGAWVDGNNQSAIYEGPTLIKDYPAPIEILPYFFRNGTEIFTDNAGVTCKVSLVLVFGVVAIYFRRLF